MVVVGYQQGGLETLIVVSSRKLGGQSKGSTQKQNQKMPFVATRNEVATRFENEKQSVKSKKRRMGKGGFDNIAQEAVKNETYLKIPVYCAT